MKKRRNNSARASTLQIALSTGLISISAILLATAAPGNRERASRQDPSRFQLEEDAGPDSITALGHYPDTSILLSTDTTVTPDATPTNTTSINVSTSTNFNGRLEGDPTTGVVRVTDAHPAGTYTVTVRAFNGGGQTATKTFTLTVTTPATCLPVSFAPATNFGAPVFPVFVAVGDFNGDGKQDLAVASFGIGPPHPFPGSMHILLGDGAGNFSVTSIDSVPFAHPISVTVGDFNNDGNQDLAVPDGDGRVWILLGDGAGNFPTATFLDTGSQTTVTVGDFNGDGKEDLAVPNYGSNNVSILLGDGTGSFSAATNFGAGTGPSLVAVGDFNGDGKQDLATANDGSDNVSILLGNGAGSFSAATNFGAGAHPQSVAVGDFNSDGNQDLAVANQGSNNVSILLGNGAGSFIAASNFGAGTTPNSVALGDFNADGKQDLAVANFQSSGTVSILLGDGVGNFSAPISFSVGDHPISIAVGDFNTDGKQDFAVANPSSANVSILLRACAATPTPTATATPSASPTPCPLFSATGTVGQCTAAGPSGIPLAGVTITRTISGGGGGGSTTTDENGHYFLDGFSCVTNTFTPSKAARLPGSPGIDIIDVLAVQRHFLTLSLLQGCRLAAADCASPVGISTTDVIAIQRFFLGQTTGIGNVGNYGFTPASRTYSPPVSNQTGQDYQTIVFGDVASPFAAP